MTKSNFLIVFYQSFDHDITQLVVQSVMYFGASRFRDLPSWAVFKYFHMQIKALNNELHAGSLHYTRMKTRRSSRHQTFSRNHTQIAKVLRKE